MPEILIVNPNTTGTITALLQRHGDQQLAPQASVRAVTARFGAPYIVDEASFAVASHATLDAWAAALAEGAAPDAVLIGCFGDPGLAALRDSSAAPVTGLAEAAVLEAAALGRFAIVTGGAQWPSMLRRLVQALGQAEALDDIVAVAPSGAQLAADPQGAQGLLRQACLEAARRPGVRSVVLGGAGLAGLAEPLQPSVPVPLIDSVQAGLRRALALAGTTPRARPVSGFDVAWRGLSAEMTALGRR